MILDRVPTDSTVTLNFTREERHATAVLVSRTGEGDDRRITFRSVTGDREFEWDAYRSQGAWRYGGSADRLSLVRVES
jgi:hypothetical protein